MPEPAPCQHVASQLDYPMIVITAAADGVLGGCLVGFQTQCSIDPARFLVCLSTNNHTLRVASRADHLGVHFLDERDFALASLFGEQTGDQTDKFAACAWRTGQHGVPVLTDVRAW